FERTFTLPARVRKQHAKAVYSGGLLEIRLLKEGRAGEGEGSLIDVDFM
ncbi:MAG: Hsp20/alpha crystallin family protein, partial [Alicyclobacillaceae bacterium]|nr:Hsp20/alpha crystallin family protein [Alicyclobacillaceae bacterium]